MSQHRKDPAAAAGRWSPWLVVALLSTGLAVCSLLSNLQSLAMLSRQVPDQLSVARWVVSLLLNTGVLWAAAQLAAGAVLARPLHGAWAAVLTGELSLVLHYALGRLLGIMPPGVWAENRQWFVTAVVAGVPLGALGALWRSGGLGGLVARLLVPVGAVTEPLLRNWLGRLPEGVEPSTPSLVAEPVSGWVMLAAGTCGGVVTVLRWWRRRTRGQGSPGS